MAKAVKQSMTAVYYPTNGKFNAAAAFQRAESGATGLTIPGAGDKTPLFGTDAYGNPINVDSERGTPGAPAITLQNYVTFAQDALQKAQIKGLKEYVQIRIHNGISLDIPTGWDGIIHMGNTQPGDISLSDPTSREFASARIEQDIPFNPDYALWVWKGSLSSQTTTEAEAANDVWFLSQPNSLADNGNGYPGADEVGFIACDAGSSATANILFTVTGGSTWTACTADPFGNDEHASHLCGTVINKTQGRVLVGRTVTDAGAAAEIAIGDFSLSSGDVSSWTTVDVGSTNGEVITATFWSERNPNNVYVATDGGDIYLSTNRGESFSSTFTGSNDIRKFYENADGYIYAVGDSNTILVEKDQSGTFDSLTGPTGSNASHAIAVTQDAIWLGNGTSLFYTRNLEPTSASDWTSSKDFGTNHRVETISPKGRSRWPGGDSQLLHVMVNDTSTPEGDLWMTADGGGTWEEITNLTNTGYNGAYFSPIDDNLGFIVGEVQSSLATIHKYSA